MELNEKDYNEKIKIFYYNSLNNTLLNKSIKCLKDNNCSFKLIKAAKGREVFKINLEQENYYLKKYSYQRFSKKFKNLFRSAPALRALKITKKLVDKEISVVEPILAVIYRRNLWTADSIFVTKDFGGVDLQDFLAYGDYDLDFKRQVVREVARIWAGFYKGNFLNGDPNLASILIKHNNASFELGLVDVDNVRSLSFLSWKLVVKNLIEFNAHSYSGLYKMKGKKLDQEDRFLFLEEFIKIYGKKEINIKELADYIGKKTIKRLTDWGKQDLILNDKRLSQFL
ncbi:lipopolysaccharide kinase InaA family protein [Halocella sp. SP3-1]|uniref:lipopolysaccharide kinase InaA family protein n=1 Tax=Halocella sp. SP3-1 TaxID=2382161 RepID=UPI000F752104|nr:lipopolysaccharide kinase InaA family protein [Halocella sp. SP3-1]AZO93928.1 hypothetical protein D7D81_04615 [Halocella sp. SP3-1]